MSFKDKNVLITGATSGIGKTTAFEFAKEGANVVITGRREKLGKEIEQQALQQGLNIKFYMCDVSKEESVKTLFTFIESLYKTIDIAFNNAGIGGPISNIHTLNLNDWQETLDINLTGVMLCMKYQIALMLKTETQGVIVNMSSLWGTGSSNMGVAAYSASKHGVIGLTKAAALEYAEKNIRINAICPAWVPTDANEHVLSDNATKQQIETMHPLNRLGTQEEIAQTVIWLSSEKAGFITGQEIVVDGGISARR